MNSFENSPNYFWAVIVDQNEKHIGNMNAYVDEQDLTGDIGILIGEKEYWGKGYGLEAYQIAMEYLFNEVGLRKITAGTMEPNIGMLRIMERLKMKPDGRRVGHVLYEGRAVDIVHMASFREEWNPSGG
jgi:RimJ/RimL family protein N-acetyltransferase